MSCEKGPRVPGKFIGAVIGSNGIIAMSVERRVDFADVAGRGVVYEVKKISASERFGKVSISAAERNFIDRMNA